MKKLRTTLLPVLFILSISAFGQKDSTNTKEPWVAPPQADELTNPFVGDKEALKKGRVIYTSECVVCHGANGDAVTNVAKNLQQKPKNFTMEDFQKQTDGAIFYKLSEGRGLMQPFKTMLSEEEIWSVIEYVKYLARDDE
ncbi:MAG: c-type cytochrome [Cyclobacteriaceae bacterium]